MSTYANPRPTCSATTRFKGTRIAQPRQYWRRTNTAVKRRTQKGRGCPKPPSRLIARLFRSKSLSRKSRKILDCRDSLPREVRAVLTSGSGKCTHFRARPVQDTELAAIHEHRPTRIALGAQSGKNSRNRKHRSLWSRPPVSTATGEIGLHDTDRQMGLT